MTENAYWIVMIAVLVYNTWQNHRAAKDQKTLIKQTNGLAMAAAETNRSLGKALGKAEEKVAEKERQEGKEGEHNG